MVTNHSYDNEVDIVEKGEKQRRKVPDWVKRLIMGVVLCGLTVGLLYAIDSCHTTIDREKLRDISYEIVDEEYIPAEIYEQLVQDMDEVNRKSYLCSDNLYIVVCYGAQPTGGYSIQVDELYESSNAIIVDTTLIGPSKQDKVDTAISYPYIVLKVENVGKTVVFN